MQKFHKYDHVQIAKDLGGGMSHFENDTDAVVIGSYADQFGGSDTKSYTLYVNGHGEISWYEEWQLTLLDKNGKKLLKDWKSAAKIKSDRESDLDWIFQNGLSVLKGASGSSVESLASCLGITNLWGSSGEGYVYYMNAMKVLSLAKPYLEKNDKDGWITFCKEIKSS